MASSDQHTTPATEGWGNPSPFDSRSKFHYFRKGMSLCRKWGIPVGQIALEQGNDDHSDNCAPCKRLKLRESTQNSEGQG